MSLRPTQTFGAWGEAQAAAFLVRHGFVVIEQNYHATVGEIDIIAKKGDDFYFIEVKTRRAGSMAYDVAVTPGKKRKLLKTINHYAYHRDIPESRVLASLMVVVDKNCNRVQFRLAVLY